MGKLSLATKLADELGVSAAKARKFVDDVGADMADDVTQAADEGTTLGDKWFKRTAAVGAAGGGGALAWRQQDIEQLQAANNRQQTSLDAAQWLADSDLSPELKKQLAKDLVKNSNGGNQNGGNQDGGGLIPGDIQTTLVLVIVMVVVLKFALDGGVP